MNLDSIEDSHSVILCDIWGCIHDGVSLYPGAADRLRQWREKNRTVVLITNAPRTARAVGEQLVRLGLDTALWDGIATSGEAGIAALARSARPVGFIGTESDREILAGRGVRIADDGDFDEIACAGLDGRRRQVSDYETEIAPLAERGVVMHCLNPDRVVIRGGVAEPCAGAIADRYVELGGPVEYYGKPYPAIYRHALSIAGNPHPGDVLAIGDGLHTDILGAARAGLPCVYVTGGISRGKGIPDGFAEANGLDPGWKPVAVLDSIA